MVKSLATMVTCGRKLVLPHWKLILPHWKLILSLVSFKPRGRYHRTLGHG